MHHLFPPSLTVRCVALATAAVLAGCADPGLVQVAPDQYRIVKSDKVHFYRTTAELKADAVKEAEAYASARGMVAVQIVASEQPMVPGVEFATVKYVFRLADKGGSVSVRPIVAAGAQPVTP